MFEKFYQGLFTITALCSFINGLAYLVFPVPSLAILGVAMDNYSLTITRYYGACAIGWGLLLWLARRSTRTEVIRAVLWSILVTLGISALVGIVSMLEGVFNLWGWSLVLTDSMISLLALFSLFQLRGLDTD